MRIDLPFTVEYGTPDAVPINEIIDSLVSVRTLIEEGGGSLPQFVDGLSVEQVQVFVRSISQESPLREVLLVSIFLAFQSSLEKEVPELIRELTGTSVPEHFHSLVTVVFLIILFYGTAYVKDLVIAKHEDSRVKRQLSALIRELAERTGKTEDQIRRFFDDRYKEKGRVKTLASAAIGFFRPSKSQSNAPIKVAERHLSTDIISDVPAEYAYEEAITAESAREFRGVDLELHAQDRDRDQSGWAAIAKGVSDKRLRMKLVDGVNPNALWGKDKVKGDIIVKYKRTGLDMMPTEIHLSRVIR